MELGGKILHGSKDVGHHLLALLGRFDPLHTLGGHLDHLRALDSRLNHLHAHDGYLYYLLALCGHLEHLLTLRDQLLCVGVIGNQLGNSLNPLPALAPCDLGQAITSRPASTIIC